MANVSPALIIPFTVGTSQIVGQGNYPIVRCRLSFDDYSDPTPSWTEVAPADFRSFSTSRGRENELQMHDAGTATVVLDNRDRAYDPNLHANITPMNRVWLYEEFSGEVQDIFMGYVEVWDQSYPATGYDQIVTIQAVDEFKLLALQTMPTTSPPRQSYDEVINADLPAGYWRLNEDPLTFVQDSTDISNDPNNVPNNFSDPGPLWNRHRGWLR